MLVMTVASEEDGATAAEPGGAAEAAAHAGLVLGGPYTSDTQVVFCPGLDRQYTEGEEELAVSWLRRHVSTGAIWGCL